MHFHSFTFALLLVPTLVIYWLSPWQRLRLASLFVASIVFYGWQHWPSVLLLLATIGINYFVALQLEQRRSRSLLAGIILFDLSLLFWFKYASFVSEQLIHGAALLGVDLPIPQLRPGWVLGISFFTFQVIAYQVDVFRGTVAAERSLLVFAVFKSFFAQLIAGPIVRAQDFLPQLRKRVTFDAARFHHGLFLFVIGLSLKVGVADVLRQFSDEAFKTPDALVTSTAWLGLYAFAFQLFADFWGYSTMAVGLGELFCLTLPFNFDAPYLSASLQEFWRRWHITLSNWFRDYVYIPLGGNRRAATRNLLVTMTVAGLWHGAGWNFMFWGLLHGAWLGVERKLELATEPTLFARVVRTFLVFHGVCLLWVLFRAPSFASATAYFAKLLLPPYGFQTAVPETLAIWLLGFGLFHFFLSRMMTAERFHAAPAWRQVAVSWGLLLLAMSYSGQKYDFVYFAF